MNMTSYGDLDTWNLLGWLCVSSPSYFPSVSRSAVVLTLGSSSLSLLKHWASKFPNMSYRKSVLYCDPGYKHTYSTESKLHAIMYSPPHSMGGHDIFYPNLKRLQSFFQCTGLISWFEIAKPMFETLRALKSITGFYLCFRVPLYLEETVKEHC